MTTAPRRNVRVILVVAMLAIAGVALLSITQGSGSSYEPRPLTGTVSESLDLDLAQSADFGNDKAPAETVGATSAYEAVASFVAAEAAGDYATSFALLAADDRQRYGDPSAWQFAHQSLPVILTHDDPTSEGDQFPTEVRLQPQLNLSVGMMPSQATLRFTPVDEEGGWRVAYSETMLEAQFPDEAVIPAVVLDWAEATQRCAPTEELEFESGLLGAESLADQLCGSEGPIKLSDQVAGLDDLQNPAVILNAFGPTAGDYVRIVDISGPIPMRILTAPYGDDWLVVGVSAPGL